MTKKFVTLRFGQILSNDALDEIHERIRREAQLTRQINDRLDAASNFENVTIRINSQTLRITTRTEAKQRLLTSGFTLVSSGYASEVVELKKLLSEDDAREPRIALVLAHAEYMLSQYLKARALLGDATLRAGELSEDDRSFLQMLSDACDYQMGQIDAVTAIRRTTENLQHSSGQFSTAFVTSY
jgi:formate dehydrogenase assembly factor FdhD